MDEKQKWEITTLTYESGTIAGTIEIVKSKVRTGFLWMVVSNTECLGKDMKWETLLDRTIRDDAFYSNFYFSSIDEAMLVANKYLDGFKQHSLTRETEYERTQHTISKTIGTI